MRIAPGDVAAMFLAVFMLYATDRLLDAKPLFALPLLPELEARHLFHHKHRSAFLFAILLGCPPLAWLLRHTAEPVLHLYVTLACLLCGWLLLVHARPAPSASARRLPKELAVGLFFPAAVFIPTVGRAPSLRAPLLPLAVLFASVCTLNCLYLYAWEHPGGLAHAHPSTRWGIRRLPLLAAASTLLSLLLLAAVLISPGPQRAWLGAAPHLGAAFLACGCSSALLMTLNARRGRLPPLLLRALADLVLLTPVPILLAVRSLRHHGF